MKLSSYVYMFLFMLLASAWSINHYDKMAKVGWLIGTWQMETANGYIYESWKKVTHNELTGKSYMLQKTDSITFETMKLVQRRDSLFYVPTVKKQNHGMPVSFTLTSLSENQLIFENHNHDFPQVISYRRIGNDSLIAEISGKQNGKARIEKFPMKKIK